MKIYTPVKGATGTWCSVHFANGVGETNDPHLIKWFKSHGYRVEGSEEVETTEPEPIKIEPVRVVDTPDFESMTPNELREWGKIHGYGGKIKSIRNKEKLIEILRG